jgi:hypothetical protein
MKITQAHLTDAIVIAAQLHERQIQMILGIVVYFPKLTIKI